MNDEQGVDSDQDYIKNTIVVTEHLTNAAIFNSKDFLRSHH